MFGTKKTVPIVVRKEHAATTQQQQNAIRHSRNSHKPIPPRPTSLSTQAQAIARDKARNGTSSPASRNGNAHVTKTASKPERKAGRLAVPNSASRKRQRNGTPVGAVDWGASDGEDSAEDDEEDVLGSGGKRARKLDNASLELDDTRDLWELDRIVTEEDIAGLIHGADLTSGKLADTTGVTSNKYKEIFERAEGDGIPVVLLQYPSNSPPERFELVWPKDRHDFNPLNEIHDTVKAILTHYLPASRSEQYLDEASGIPRRFQTALNKQSLIGFTTALDEYNELIRACLKDGTVAKHLSTQRQVPLPLVERILERQCYDRTVGPQVERLSVRKDLLPSKSNTYGEIRPRLTHDIFRESKLRSDDVFVDLGSGVGNVVLQAALEVGCESWGVEMMPLPALYAGRQLAELQRRCALYAVRPGAARLFEGDMLATPAIDAALARADVVLVNNKVFEAPLNAAIALKFLDLKEGARVISLQPFVRGKVKITELNMHDPSVLLTLVGEMEYGSNRVSWSDAPGDWYLSVKDSSKLRDFTERMARR